MPSTVNSVMAAAGLKPAGLVQWATRVGEPGPGVYVISMTAATEHLGTTLRTWPGNGDAVDEILTARPELIVDGSRPSAEDLSARLAGLWLPDESIVYIGLAGTSLQKRVGQYYSTKLGARSPHAGGWPLKILKNLTELYVHFAPCQDPKGAEDRMIGQFVAAVSQGAREALHDPAHPFPYANLEWPQGVRKVHGIKGAKAARRSAPTGRTTIGSTPRFAFARTAVPRPRVRW